MSDSKGIKSIASPTPPSTERENALSFWRPSTCDGGWGSKQHEQESSPERGVQKHSLPLMLLDAIDEANNNGFATRSSWKEEPAEQARSMTSSQHGVPGKGRSHSSRLDDFMDQKEGDSMVSRAFATGLDRAASSTGYLSRIAYSATPGASSLARPKSPHLARTSFVISTVNDLNVTRRSSGGESQGVLSTDFVFSPVVDHDMKKGRTRSRDSSAAGALPPSSGHGILDQIKLPFSPFRSPLPIQGGTASGFLRLNPSNPGTLTALHESFFTNTQGKAINAKEGPEANDKSGRTVRFRQFGAKKGAGSEANTPAPSSITQRMQPAWLRNITPPSPVSAQPKSISSPGTSGTSHALGHQRRVSVSIGGAAASSAPCSAAGRTDLTSILSTSPSQLPVSAPDQIKPASVFSLSPSQTHTLASPAPAPSITVDLPIAELKQSLKNDIFGSEAPDKVHSKAIPGFTIGRVIGEGGFCQVRIAVHHLSAQKVAVKIVEKSKIQDADEERIIHREIRAMKHLNGHSRIIRLYFTVENDQFIYLAMELAAGGTLLDHIKNQKSLEKGEAARIMAQLVSGLDYCHKRGVVHRDIKLENVMMDDHNNVKLVDFGLCAFYQPGKKLKVYCGSPSYAAAEIIACVEYEAPPVDVWSLGVCFYAMLVGYLPFYNSNGKNDIDEKIMTGRFKMPDFIRASNVKTLIEGLLDVDPKKRMDLDSVLNHPWIKTHCPENYDDEPVAELNEEALAILVAAGFDKKQILRGLMDEDATELTAAYHLLALAN